MTETVVGAGRRICVGSEAGLEALTHGFNRGFSDYEYGRKFTPNEMRFFLQRSGTELEDCAVLVVEDRGGWTGAGVALLAVEGSEAWCGGLAVDPGHRRHGAGRALMHLIQERAATHDADSLWLEVLVENDAARRLYRSLGYREQRQLLIWERSSQQRTLTKSHEHLMEVEPHQILDELHQWHMLRPTWQRRAFHLRRSANLMSGFTVPAKDGSPVAYALCRETKGTRASRRESPRPADSCLHIFDAAAHPAADFQDAMHSMLRAMHARYTNSDMILLNEPADSRLNSILAEHDFEVTDRQHELLLNLT